MDEDIEEDARPFNSLSTDIKQHYDAAIVFAEEDKELAIDIMDKLNTVGLDDNENPKVCLYRDVEGAESEIEAGGEITRVCTLVLVLATIHLQNDTVASLIKDEAIGNTRLAKDCHKDLKHCVRPIYVEKERSYKPPAGLSTITGIKWYDRSTRFFQRDIKILFNLHLRYRKKRESRQQRSASCSGLNEQHNQSYATESPDSLQSSNVNISNREAMFSLNSESNDSVDLSTSGEFHLPAVESSRRSAFDCDAPNVKNNAYNLSVYNGSTLSQTGSHDSGRGGSISPQNLPSETQAASEINTVNVGDSQASDGEPEVSRPEQAAANPVGEQAPPGPTSHGHGSQSTTDNPVESLGSRGQPIEPLPEQAAAGQGNASLSDPPASDASGTSSRNRDDSKGFSVEGVQPELNIGENDIIIDSSLQRSINNLNSEETRDISVDQAPSTVAAVNNSSESSREDTSSKGRQYSGGKAEADGSDSNEQEEQQPSNNSTGGVGTHKMSTSNNSDVPQVSANDDDQTQPKAITTSKDWASEDSQDVGVHVLSYSGPAHNKTARCAAPNEMTSNSVHKAPMFPEGCSQPVVHYHTHYHGDIVDPRAYAGPREVDAGTLQGHSPAGPQLFPVSVTGITRPQEPERDAPAEINIVNCRHVQIGSGTIVTGGTGGIVDSGSLVTGSENTDQPPQYSVVDPLLTPSREGSDFGERSAEECEVERGRMQEQRRVDAYLSTQMKTPIVMREGDLVGAGDGAGGRGDGAGGRGDGAGGRGDGAGGRGDGAGGRGDGAGGRGDGAGGRGDGAGGRGDGAGGRGDGAGGRGDGAGGRGDGAGGRGDGAGWRGDGAGWRGDGAGGRGDGAGGRGDGCGEPEELIGDDQSFINMKSFTFPSSLPVVDAAKSFPDKESSDLSDESDDSSLPSPGLGSGDDLKVMLNTPDDNMAVSTNDSKAGPEADRTEGSLCNSSFASCRMFCLEKNASRTVPLMETCVDCGN